MGRIEGCQAENDSMMKFINSAGIYSRDQQTAPAMIFLNVNRNEQDEKQLNLFKM